jgi:hypothetical protein
MRVLPAKRNLDVEWPRAVFERLVPTNTLTCSPGALNRRRNFSVVRRMVARLWSAAVPRRF